MIRSPASAPCCSVLAMADQRDDRFWIKQLSADGIAAAQEKAEQYRRLNEAREAESISRDILRVEPDNQKALVTLLLALTDRFRRNLAHKYEQARELIPRLSGEYERAYYSGIICERRAKAHHLGGAPGCGPVAYEWLRDAMDWFEKAEEHRPPGNDDAVLRWNTCVRMIRTHPGIAPAPEDTEAPLMLE